MAGDVVTLTIGSTLVPRDMFLSPRAFFRPLPYKAACAGLVHRVFHYGTWIGLDCGPHHVESFVVLEVTKVITCLWCIYEAVRCGR